MKVRRLSLITLNYCNKIMRLKREEQRSKEQTSIQDTEKTYKTLNSKTSYKKHVSYETPTQSHTPYITIQH